VHRGHEAVVGCMVADFHLVRDDRSTPEQWRSSFAEAHQTWTDFSTAVAAVTVAGPVAAANAADELRLAMYEWEKAGIDWYAAARREGHGRLDACYDRFEQAWQAKRPRTAPSSTPPGKPWAPKSPDLVALHPGAAP
jgi:hypothetical protein